MRLLVCFAAAFALVASGCQKELTYFECYEDAGVSGDTGPVAAALVGDPCEGDDDCPAEDGWTPWCLTSDGLAAEVADAYDVPGGICSLPDCSSDADCGGNAVCVDGGGFFYCARACESCLDCRYMTGMSCSMVGDAGPACVPEGAAALSQCGDSVCDEDERYDPTLCPEDCPDGVPSPSLVGGPCETNDDCAEGITCFTDAVMEIVSPGTEVPGGMCANHPLFDGSCTTDEECGEGAACIDATALLGTPLALCLHTCEDDSDCRVLDGYRCYDTGLVGPKGCLPQQLVAAIRCQGDGECDLAEILDPDLCPDDNCGE